MSASCVVLLRAVNVGGTARVPMADLHELAARLGATDISTYIASGNLLCTPSGDPAEFERALENAIEEKFDFFREAVSRSREELLAAIDAHPFEVVNAKSSMIVFLASKPAVDALDRATALPTGDDRWRVIGRDLHLRFAESAGKPQMKLATIIKTLGVAGTARNLLTVRKLIDLLA